MYIYITEKNRDMSYVAVCVMNSELCCVFDYIKKRKSGSRIYDSPSIKSFHLQNFLCLHFLKQLCY